MHLHNRPHFKLQDDHITCSLHSVGNDLEQLPVSVDVKDLQKLILPSSTKSVPACSAMSLHQVEVTAGTRTRSGCFRSAVRDKSHIPIVPALHSLVRLVAALLDIIGVPGS